MNKIKLLKRPSFAGAKSLLFFILAAASANAFYNPRTGKDVQEADHRLVQPHSHLGPSAKYEYDQPDLLYYGYRYYNASTGRWLNRDPLAEDGGMNLMCFVRNQPLSQSDVDGRSMTLTETLTPLDMPPTTGPMANWYGATFFATWAPRAWNYKYPFSPCCWKIKFGGKAWLVSWWVPGTSAPDGTSSYNHELQHVQNARNVFHGYDSFASSYDGPCFSREKAACYSSMILSEMQAAYVEMYTTENMDIDCRSYGKYCDLLPAQKRKESLAWQRFADTLRRCDALP